MPAERCTRVAEQEIPRDGPQTTGNDAGQTSQTPGDGLSSELPNKPDGPSEAERPKEPGSVPEGAANVEPDARRAEKIFGERVREARESKPDETESGDPTVELEYDQINGVELDEGSVQGWIERLERNGILSLTSWDAEILHASVQQIAKQGRWQEPGQRRRAGSAG